MTASEALGVQSRTYRRARALQARMNELASLATLEGRPAEGEKLRAIGARVWLVADRYVEAVFAGVE